MSGLFVKTTQFDAVSIWVHAKPRDPHYRGRYALMRRQEIVGVYDTIRDAQLTGRTVYEDGLFFVEKPIAEPVNPGFFSPAVSVADP